VELPNFEPLPYFEPM